MNLSGEIYTASNERHIVAIFSRSHNVLTAGSSALSLWMVFNITVTVV